MSLGAGAIACTYAASLRRRLGAGVRSGDAGRSTWLAVARTLSVGLLVVISLFWAASEYARALGRGRSQVLEANLLMRPGVAVYSTQPLHLEGAGVVASELTPSDGAYHFRYEGLRLFLRSGEKYFLLPAGRPHAGGPSSSATTSGYGSSSP